MTFRAFPPGIIFASRHLVLWPDSIVERSAATGFTPAHCPWKECPSNDPIDPEEFRYRCHGSFRRKTEPNPIPRRLCLCCGRTFSSQTFSFSYYLKRPGLSVPVAAGLVAGSANRQIARSHGCAPSTVTRRATRLGRHALRLHGLCLDNLRVALEPLVYDHFETFAHSQDEPCGIGTLLGHRSRFFYALDFAPHRRSGRMTPAQRARRDELFRGVPRRDPYRAACRETLSSVLRLVPPEGRLVVHADGHKSYLRVVEEAAFRDRVRWVAFPNPRRGPKGSARSPEAIARDRAMFAVDEVHRLLRHTFAHHRRETIAFGRRHNAVLERAGLFVVWRNLVKKRTERRPERRTAAMLVGLTSEAWSWERVLEKRLFPWKIPLSETWERVYRREILTRGLAINSTHDLKNAA